MKQPDNTQWREDREYKVKGERFIRPEEKPEYTENINGQTNAVVGNSAGNGMGSRSMVSKATQLLPEGAMWPSPEGEAVHATLPLLLVFPTFGPLIRRVSLCWQLIWMGISTHCFWST